MRMIRLTAMTAAVYMVMGIGIASAASYTFYWMNHLNRFSHNATGVCTNMKTEILLAGKVIASTTFTQQIAVSQYTEMTTLTPLVAGDSIRSTATCTFKDYKGNFVTATKSKTDMLVEGCAMQAGVYPEPFNASWTSFSISTSCNWGAE